MCPSLPFWDSSPFESNKKQSFNSITLSIIQYNLKQEQHKSLFNGSIDTEQRRLLWKLILATLNGP